MEIKYSTILWTLLILAYLLLIIGLYNLIFPHIAAIIVNKFIVTLITIGVVYSLAGLISSVISAILRISFNYKKLKGE